MKKLIKNDIVKMDWDADAFFESRSRGFVAAVNVYKTSEGPVPVVFQDKKIFILLDPDTVEPTTLEDITQVIKDCYKDNIDLEDAFPESYVELGVGVVLDEDVANQYGLTDADIADINNRIDDLMPYWEIVEEEIF